MSQRRAKGPRREPNALSFGARGLLEYVREQVCAGVPVNVNRLCEAAADTQESTEKLLLEIMQKQPGLLRDLLLPTHRRHPTAPSESLSAAALGALLRIQEMQLVGVTVTRSILAHSLGLSNSEANDILDELTTKRPDLVKRVHRSYRVDEIDRAFPLPDEYVLTDINAVEP